MKLTRQQRRITQDSHNEGPYDGEYYDHWEKGTYNCLICDQPLFSSEHKYKNLTGYASFHHAIGNLVMTQNQVVMHSNFAFCENCGAYIGYPIVDQIYGDIWHYRVMSQAVKFVPAVKSETTD